MSDHEPSREEIEVAFQQACYSGLLEHAEVFKAAAELGEILQLMAPYHVRKISRISTKNLCNLIGLITSAAYEDLSETGKKSDLPDPLIYNSEVKNILRSSSAIQRCW